jgi:PIN domain nuclease of toxin-antitoxin system
VDNLVTTLLLDSHVLHWSSAEPSRLSDNALRAVSGADELAIASISWFELAWLAENGRITVGVPVRAWLETLAAKVRTVPTSPAIAATAVSLPASFPRDAADRLIFATAIEKGWSLVTKDVRLRQHKHPRPIAIW